MPTAWIIYTSSCHPAQQTVHRVQQSKCTAVQVLQGSPMLQVVGVVGGSSSRFSSFRSNRNPQPTLVAFWWGWRKHCRCWMQTRSLWCSGGNPCHKPQRPDARQFPDWRMSADFLVRGCERCKQLHLSSSQTKVTQHNDSRFESQEVQHPTTWILKSIIKGCHWASKLQLHRTMTSHYKATNNFSSNGQVHDRWLKAQGPQKKGTYEDETQRIVCLIGFSPSQIKVCFGTNALLNGSITHKKHIS